MKQKIILCLMSAAILLSGCATEETKVTPMTQRAAGKMEKEPVIEYTIPDCTPGILIDQAGYRTEDRKIAIFRGDTLPAVFRVHDAKTGAVVLEGSLEIKGEDKITEEQIGYADFSKVQAPGEYYLKSDILGYSYTFSIGDKIYEELFAQNLKSLYEKTQDIDTLNGEEICRTSKAVINMLLAYEMHKTAFDDHAGIKDSGNGIPDVVDVLLAQILLLAEQEETVLSSADWETVSYYASAMAKFSYTYKDFDNAYATSCLQLADSVWRYMEKNAGQVEEKFRFMAATELYRASGEGKYHRYIEEFCQNRKKAVTSTHEEVYGAVTYIATKQRVDVDICTLFMKEIMNEAEKIAAQAKNSYYQVNGSVSQENNEEILWDMVVITVVDHVIASHEYAMIIENHLHYLLGRNSMAVSYMDGVGEREYSAREGQQSIMDGGFMESALLFMLSEINEKEETVEE